MKKKSVRFLGVVFLALSLCACGGDSRSEDVVLLYTTDVHCGVNDKLGYSAVSSYKKEMAKSHKYVSLLDAGDYIQGDVIGAFSHGESIVKIMNEMDYEVVTIGNHEFDYGMDALGEVINGLKAEVVSCNLEYVGSKTNKLAKVKPYAIKQYGDLKIGIVGVTTPESLTDATPSIFKEDGKTVYSFHNENEEAYYKKIQDTIDLCNKEANYTVLLTHAGNDDAARPWSSRDIIANTSGYLAVMDGHSHYDVQWEKVKNKEGKDIPLCDAGYKLNEFGKLVIHKDGSIDTEFISDYSIRDKGVQDYVDAELSKTKAISDRVVAHTNLALSISDLNGIRIVRSRETAIGNLTADSCRLITGADIGFVNGGGIRTDLPSGDITYGQVFDVNPFGNYIVLKEVSGSDILDYLEHCSQATAKDYQKDGHPNGEFGGFAQVSGLRYTIDTSIPTPVIVDQAGNFVKIEGPRRVKNVQVLVDGTYVDIDPAKTYRVAANNYILIEGGNGANMFMDDPEIEAPVRVDFQVIVDYITNVLKGNLSEKYSSTEGRIEVL